MRIVLDTNVFISGIFWSGPPYQILKAWQSGQINLVVSKEILDEYDRVAKHLNKKHKNIDLSSIIKLVTIEAELCHTKPLSRQISRDPDDDKFIACAMTANVKFIISGDQDLLSISGYKRITVLKPVTFVNKYLI